MGGMLAHFWKRSDRGKLLSLEGEVLKSIRELRKAEDAYFENEDNAELCTAWTDAQVRHDLAVDRLTEVEGK